jgi:MFS family permease
MRTRAEVARPHSSWLPADDQDVDPRRWRMLAVLAVAELLGMSLWFGANAVAGQFQAQFQLTEAQVGWLTTSVQLGFVVGTAVAALLNLADIVPAARFFAVCAVLGAAVNALLVWVTGFGSALTLRFLTGFFLAGVYPPAMKMVATWFGRWRGLAIGTVVGALTVGKATPYLVHAFPDAGMTTVLLIPSVAAVSAALLVTLSYREGPFPFVPRPFSLKLGAQVLSDRRWRLIMGGYLGHMFELYSFWTWIPAFLAASEAARGAPDESRASLLAFAAIATGGAGCIWGGWVADRSGRERLVINAMAASGTCALLIGLLFGKSLWLIGPIALLWGFFVIADSAQFSALVTEVAPGHAVGTALTLQLALGFLLTTVSIQLVPPFVDLFGWRWSFAVLALGPLFGIAAIRRLLANAHVMGATPA